jgi:tripartite-type tricarboxylate transporter receptor subunit TctC
MQTKRTFVRATLACVAACAAFAGATGALAQAYPSKPIRVIVPYAAGGATDGVARQVGVALGEKLGQTIIVDNKPGGSTVVAAQALAIAPPDGYTMAIFDPSTVSMNQFLFKKPPYDPSKFVPLTTLVRIPFGIMALPSFPANNLKEFVAYVKANPGLGFGSSGAGNPVHLSMESFRAQAGLDMTHVPYKGGAPAIQDLLGGQIPMMIMDVPSAMQHIKAGKIKVIALTTAKRSELLPDVPTIAESGYPGFEASSWFGAFVPAGTPPAVTAKLAGALRDVIATPQMGAWIKSMTFESYTTATPEEFAGVIRKDADSYSKIIGKLGLSLD